MFNIEDMLDRAFENAILEQNAPGVVEKEGMNRKEEGAKRLALHAAASQLQVPTHPTPTQHIYAFNLIREALLIFNCLQLGVAIDLSCTRNAGRFG